MKSLMTVVLLGALTVPVWAQDPEDAPENGVARISLLKGDVAVRRGDSGELIAAELNAPLVALDHVLTEADSRVEIQFDWANMARLAPDSEVRLAELADRDFLIQIDAGTVTFRVLRDSQAQVEISTPTASVRPQRDGTYRITVRDDNSTEITVRSGEAEIYAGGKTDSLRVGQTLVVRGDPSDPQMAYRAAEPRDEWDRWNESRDRDLERNDSYKYVSRDIYGAEDLGGYGRWVYDSPYGWVWVPRVDSAWAPYRIGRWSWVNYYGWTWVSGDPWGWAPYHYGRWYHAPRHGWVWYPGEIHVRHRWSPGLVAFFGWGSNVGWVALAPREVYRPWYGRNRSVFVNNVTVVNNINVVNTYRNARFISGRSGVTSVVNLDFGRRSVNQRNFIVGNDRDFARASDAGRWLQREPSREHRQFSDRQVSTRVIARRDVPREFVTRPGRNDRDNRGGLVQTRVPPNNSTPQAARRADAPPRTEPVVARTPAPDISRGSSSDARARSDRRNESVVFPRSQAERDGQQPQTNPGRGQSLGGASTEGRRVTADARTRSDQSARTPETNRAREETFVRQPRSQPEARPDPAARASGRAEAFRPSAAPVGQPARGGPARVRPEESVRPQTPANGPGRSAPQGRVRSEESPRPQTPTNAPGRAEPQGRVRSAESGSPSPVAAARPESRNGQAPSSSGPAQGNSGGRGRR